MKKKHLGYSYVGNIDRLPTNKVYINVTFLELGRYEINIVHQNKIVKKVFFDKNH